MRTRTTLITIVLLAAIIVLLIASSTVADWPVEDAGSPAIGSLSTDCQELLVNGDFEAGSLPPWDGGGNIGMRLALEEGARWVFLLNQDARVEPRTIGELVRVSLAHPRFGVLSPFHLDGEGNELDARFANYLHGAGAQLLSDLYFDRKREVYSTVFVNAAAWLITRDCLDTVGGFDPLFFMYGEDNDYCNRARWHGFKIGLVPNAIAFHDRPQELFPRGGERIRLRSIIAWRFSVMLYSLKQPRGTFLRRIGSWGLTNLRTGLALLGAGQLRDLLAWMIGLIRIAFCLPRIWIHRMIDREPGRHWI